MVKFESFRDSSMVEQVAVNDKVLGSSPSRGASLYSSNPFLFDFWDGKRDYA